MSQLKYDLSSDQVAWVEDQLSNDEVSSDVELIGYFVANGLPVIQAKSVVTHRQDYLLNIYRIGQGPLHGK
ncbi:MAG: hypothetical protein ACREO1_07755 [Arenimonas sp.]